MRRRERAPKCGASKKRELEVESDVVELREPDVERPEDRERLIQLFRRYVLKRTPENGDSH